MAELPPAGDPKFDKAARDVARAFPKGALPQDSSGPTERQEEIRKILLADAVNLLTGVSVEGLIATIKVLYVLVDANFVPDDTKSNFQEELLGLLSKYELTLALSGSIPDTFELERLMREYDEIQAKKKVD